MLIDQNNIEDTEKKRYIKIGSRYIRKNRVVFVIVIFFAWLSVIWPGHALFSSIEPFILGFPFSFMWLIIWVIISFIAMLWLYLTDIKYETNKE